MKMRKSKTLVTIEWFVITCRNSFVFRLTLVPYNRCSPKTVGDSFGRAKFLTKLKINFCGHSIIQCAFDGNRGSFLLD